MNTERGEQHIINIDINKLQAELEAQEFAIDEAEWNSLLVSIKRAEVDNGF